MWRGFEERRSRRSQAFAVFAAVACLGGLLPAVTGECSDDAAIPVDNLPRPLPSEVPLGLPPTLGAFTAPGAVVTLGRKLFFDPILSYDRTVSCASCHQPEHGFADTKPLSTGALGRTTLRNAPTLYNRALGKSFMWDGRAPTLRDQVLLPIENELEMSLPIADAVARLSADPTWRSDFEHAFGSPPQRAHLADALSAFVRRIVYANTRVDRFRTGAVDALTVEERGGMWLFESRGACWSCHSGPNFTDEKFHNTGIGVRDGIPEPGRFAVTNAASDRGRFKTPTLRGLAETGPYMHDGSLATLEDVVEFYRRAGHANSNLDPLIKPIEMSDQDARNLVAFLRALSRS